jgi:hypothetical protein
MVLKNKEETAYELSFKHRKMFESIDEEKINEIIIYSDNCFVESDIGFIRNDILNELKKQYNVHEEKMRYFGTLNISMDKRIIIKTYDVEELLDKLFNLGDFYQTMYKYKPLDLDEHEPEIDEDEEADDGEEDEYESQFHYY